MTGSFIHTAFDPSAYVVFSACSLAMGIVLGASWTGDTLRRVTGYFRRNVARDSFHASAPSGSHSLEGARR